MPSPPLVPDLFPFDVAHLERATFGDPDLEREVLALFAAQSTALMPRLVMLPADVRNLAHTLKGSAMAIGAYGVSKAAEAFEAAPHDQAALRDLQNAVEAACSAIDLRMRHC